MLISVVSDKDVYLCLASPAFQLRLSSIHGRDATNRQRTRMVPVIVHRIRQVRHAMVPVISRTDKFKKPLTGELKVCPLGINPDEWSMVLISNQPCCPAPAEGVKDGIAFTCAG